MVFCIDFEVPDPCEREPRILKNNGIEQLETFRIPAPEALDNRLRVGSIQGNERCFLERQRGHAPGKKNCQDSDKQPAHDVFSFAAGAMRLQNEGTTRTDDR